jgi:translation initiation factor IF-1
MRPVAPGERDTVFAFYDTKRIGPINKTLVVATNELEHDKRIILRVAGRVLPYKMDEIQVRFQDSITLSFSEYNKAEIGVFGKTEFTLEFLNTSHDTLKIFASSRGPDLFNVIDDEFEILPGKSRSVRVKRNDKVKHFYGTIHFSLSNKKYFTIDVLK